MLASLVFVLAVGQVPAQNVRPQIGYVYPPGGRTGSTIGVKLGMYDWTPDTRIVPHDPRVKIEITGEASDFILTPPPYWFGLKAGQPQPPLAREVPARITLPADLPLGVVRFQVVNANGGSNVGQFAVSDTHEFIEPEKHGQPLELPSLPVAVSGRLSRITEVDAYQFTVAAAGLISCRLEDRLGQPFHGAATIRDAQGNVIVDAADTTGAGANLLFTAQAGAKYSLNIHDVEFGGDAGFVYRFTMRNGPQFVAMLPLVIERGKTTPVEFIGWGVATGKQELESITRDITAPADASLAMHAVVLDTPAGAARVEVQLANKGDTLRTSLEGSVPSLTLPSTISGSLALLDPAMNVPVDRYRFEAKKGDVLHFKVEAERFGSAVDPSLIILSAEGKEVARNDDVPGTTDAAVEFKAALAGTYELCVFDLSGLPPSQISTYRLTAEVAVPDFTLNVPDRFEVPLGGAADLPLKVVRQGAWKEPIAIEFENLPAGATIAGAAEIPQGKNDLKLSLAGSDKAAATASLAMLVATAKVGEQTIQHRLGPILVSTIIKTRCKVKSAVQDGGRLVNRGTTYPADIIIERLEGFEGPITLQMASTQSRQRRGMQAGALLVPAGQTQTQYPIFMPEWLETNLTCRMNVIGVAQVADPQGNLRHVTGVMDGQVVMSLEGALLKISHEPREYVASPGETIEIPVRVSRSARLAGPARVELAPDQELGSLVSAEPITIAADQSTAVVRLKVDAGATNAGPLSVSLRATMLQDGRWPVRSETLAPLVIAGK